MGFEISESVVRRIESRKGNILPKTSKFLMYQYPPKINISTKYVIRVFLSDLSMFGIIKICKDNAKSSMLYFIPDNKPIEIAAKYRYWVSLVR